MLPLNRCKQIRSAGHKSRSRSRNYANLRRTSDDLPANPARIHNNASETRTKREQEIPLRRVASLFRPGKTDLDHRKIANLVTATWFVIHSLHLEWTLTSRILMFKTCNAARQVRIAISKQPTSGSSYLFSRILMENRNGIQIKSN